MKKFLSISLVAVAMMAAGMSLSSCSNSDDGDDGTSSSEKRVESYLVGYKWYLDHQDKTEYRFYRNHLVTSVGQGRVTAGMLTYPDSRFFGTWHVVQGGILYTTFTSGPYGSHGLEDFFYPSLVIVSMKSNFQEVEFAAPDGSLHHLGSYMVGDNFVSNKFTDYTDASSHDGALVGTWRTNAKRTDGQTTEFTMKIDKKGNVHFSAPSDNIDFTTTCTTKNGHVTFDHYLTPKTNAISYIYIRENDRITLYSEKNAQANWAWEK